MTKTTKKIAFVVPDFPSVSQTWLLSQITGLLDNDVEVDIYTFKLGSEDKIGGNYFAYKLNERTRSLDFPKNFARRIFTALPLLVKLLFTNPRVFFSILNVFKYGKEALSLKLLFKVYPFIGREDKYDLIHCHFGTVANKFIPVKEILGLVQPHLCTFYGYDISHIPKEKGSDVYKNVVKHFNLFLVMSENMKKRSTELNIPAEKTIVHPISIDIHDYPYKERTLEEGESVRMTAVGRFVEKKGFDDLLRAIALVKKEAQIPFKLDLIGDGDLNDQLRSLANELEITDVVNFRGFMKLDDIKDIYEQTHVYLQPSKTASDGDME